MNIDGVGGRALSILFLSNNRKYFQEVQCSREREVEPFLSTSSVYKLTLKLQTSTKINSIYNEAYTCNHVHDSITSVLLPNQQWWTWSVYFMSTSYYTVLMIFLNPAATYGFFSLYFCLSKHVIIITC